MPDLWVRHSAESASVVRESVSVGLSGAGVSEDDAYEATLLASELVGNAVRHAPALPSGQLAIHWQIEPEGCQIAVTDGGASTSLDTSTAAASDISGRGLAIVASLAADWGVDSDEASTTVWAFYRFSRRTSMGAMMFAAC